MALYVITYICPKLATNVYAHLIVIEKGALTCCQSVSVFAVIDVNATYVVCGQSALYYQFNY